MLNILRLAPLFANSQIGKEAEESQNLTQKRKRAEERRGTAVEEGAEKAKKVEEFCVLRSAFCVP